MQPTNSFVAIGDSTTFSVSYNSMFTMKVQWQSFNEQEQEWFEMENENETQLTVTGDLCNDQRLFRAILSYGCFSVISDSATLSVHNPDSDYFIWLRDLPDDTAQEPNTLINNSNYLISPDIFVTHDPILPPLTWPYHYAINLDYNGAYIHVVVRNKGTDTSRGGKLFLYASISSSDPQWDFSFTNQVQFNFSPSWGGGITNQTIDPTNPFAMVTMGTQINEIGIDIPKIPPGGFDTITYHWDTPQNHFVVNSVQVPTLGWQTFVGKRSLVYLARIENCEEEPHGMTYSEDFFPAEPKSLYNNVRNNARIAALHSYKLPMKGPRMLIATALQVPDLWVPFDDKFNSPIELKLNTDSTDHFFNTGEVYIYFDQNLWDGFVAGGYQGSGYTIVADGIFKIDTLVPVHWDNISLAKDSIGYMGYSLHYKPGVVVPTTVVNQMFIVEIHQSGEMVGELFLHTQSQTDVEPAAFVEEESLLTQNSSFNTQNSLIFLANPNPFSDQLHIYIQAEENAVVKMYDMNGKVVATTEAFESGEKTFTINTAHLAEGVYFFRYRSGTQTIVKKVVLLR